jgi:hypothetical protein
MADPLPARTLDVKVKVQVDAAAAEKLAKSMERFNKAVQEMQAALGAVQLATYEVAETLVSQADSNT